MWVEVEESELTDNLRKFLSFRCKELKQTEWIKNEFGTTWVVQISTIFRALLTN